MKGIVFNLLEEVVTDAYGADTWDALLEAGGLEGSFTSLGSYPDQELMGLVEAAAAHLKVPAPSVLSWFGERALPRLAERYPQFFAGHDGTRSFLLTLNDVIHPEVRKVYPGAGVPEFDFDTSSEEVLVMGYRSERKLCALAEGFIRGAATYYGQSVELEQPRCMHRGDDECRLRIRLAGGR
jgi:hypothetical protein